MNCEAEKSDSQPVFGEAEKKIDLYEGKVPASPPIPPVSAKPEKPDTEAKGVKK